MVIAGGMLWKVVHVGRDCVDGQLEIGDIDSNSWRNVVKVVHVGMDSVDGWMVRHKVLVAK